MDASAIEALKLKHPTAELFLLTSESAEVVAKVTKAEVDLFRELVSSAATKAKAVERFVRACIVHPAPEEVLAILATKPGLSDKWGDELLDQAGMAEQVELKKL